ncbi:hypothetical protein DFH27DRAFT_197169 [Peziza echinospora]|nr:hypothetical protein DFH27DRAFT_197169 [Peziza echinospora]
MCELAATLMVLMFNYNEAAVSNLTFRVPVPPAARNLHCTAARSSRSKVWPGLRENRYALRGLGVHVPGQIFSSLAAYWGVWGVEAGQKKA